MHVSGHASHDELTELITLTRPRHFVPIHGEYRHLNRHVALAIEAGIPEDNCFLLEDGDSLVLSGGEARRGPTVEAGRVMLEGGGRGDPAVVSERRVLARDGTVTAMVVLSAKTGASSRVPICSRAGWSVAMELRRICVARAGELTRRLNALGGPLHANDSRLKEEIVRAIRRYFSDELGKRPLVIPYVTEV